jgi:hypothetical protein
VQSIFDLLLIFANPNKVAITPAHISILGPYDKEQYISDIELKSHEATLSGIEIFQTKNRVALVFTLEIIGISSEWHKPDYPHGKPHITIFQGEEKFAKEVIKKINISKFNHTFRITELQQINIKQMPAKQFTNYNKIKKTYKTIFRKEWPGTGANYFAKLDSDTKIKLMVKTLKFMTYSSN